MSTAAGATEETVEVETLGAKIPLAKALPAAVAAGSRAPVPPPPTPLDATNVPLSVDSTEEPVALSRTEDMVVRPSAIPVFPRANGAGMIMLGRE